MDACQTVKAYFDALITGDTDRLIKMMSLADHYVKIGTEPDEHIEGGENARDYYQRIVANAADIAIEYENLDIQERGDVAWFYTRQIWRLKWLGNPEELAVRLTGVLEKEHETWRFVQIHASVGVPA